MAAKAGLEGFLALMKPLHRGYLAHLHTEMCGYLCSFVGEPQRGHSCPPGSIPSSRSPCSLTRRRTSSLRGLRESSDSALRRRTSTSATAAAARRICRFSNANDLRDSVVDTPAAGP